MGIYRALHHLPLTYPEIYYHPPTHVREDSRSVQGMALPAGPTSDPYVGQEGRRRISRIESPRKSSHSRSM